MRLDIKKDRESLGLPVKQKYKIPVILKIAAGAAIVILLSVFAGKFLGISSRQQENTRSLQLFLKITRSTDTQEIQPLAEQMYNLAVKGDDKDKLLFSEVCFYLSAIMPRRIIWLEEALLQLEQLKGSEVEKQFYNSVMLSKTAILFELGEQRKAYELIRSINGKVTVEQLLKSKPDDITGGINYYNLYAYILARSTDKSIRNPELALELIKKVIIQPGGISAEVLDTLAEAYSGMGQKEFALNAQRHALALSRYHNLWPVTESFERFKTAK